MERAAIATADVALAHLPRFVIYSGLSAWGRHREVPHPPSRPYIWYRAIAGEEKRRSDDVLASVRANLPRRLSGAAPDRLLDPADIVVNLHHGYRRPEFRNGHYAAFHTGPSAHTGFIVKLLVWSVSMENS